MPGTRNYDTVVNGWATTLRLSDEDAKKRGLKIEDGVPHKPTGDLEPAGARARTKPEGEPKAKPARAPRTKGTAARTPRAKKGPTPANKAAEPEADKVAEPEVDKAPSGPAGDA